MAHGVLEAVLFVGRIEVATGGLEVRRIAERLGVDVDAVITDRKVLEFKLDVNAFLRGAKRRCAGVFASAGLDGYDDSSLRLGEGGNYEKAESYSSEYITHWLLFSRIDYMLRIPKYLFGLRGAANIYVKFGS
jgi:hypothetical protein